MAAIIKSSSLVRADIVLAHLDFLIDEDRQGDLIVSAFNGEKIDGYKIVQKSPDSETRVWIYGHPVGDGFVVRITNGSKWDAEVSTTVDFSLHESHLAAKAVLDIFYQDEQSKEEPVRQITLSDFIRNYSGWITNYVDRLMISDEKTGILVRLRAYCHEKDQDNYRIRTSNILQPINAFRDDLKRHPKITVLRHKEPLVVLEKVQ